MGEVRSLCTQLQVNSSCESGRGRLAVVAFGGNAILKDGQRGTVEEQTANLSEMANQLASMMAEMWSVVVTHGNGPQVGNIKLQQERADPELPAMPLDVCGAMSQGQIGYLLGQALSRALASGGIDKPVATLLTRCAVDPHDEAFSHPTKPIGPFYDEATARCLREEKGWNVVPDAGRGYRRVVPSPEPQRILESDVIRSLALSGTLVIAAGGGGIPVLPSDDGGYQGIEAVIDKDLAACLLAKELGADTLVLLTGVPQVLVNFGTPRQRPIGSLSVEEIRALDMDGHFPPGSMGPKIHAAIRFVEGGGRLAVITSTELLMEALHGRAGTRISSKLGKDPASEVATA